MGEGPTQPKAEDARPAEDLVREMNTKVEAEIRELEEHARTRIREIEKGAEAECERIEREALVEAAAVMKSERDLILGEVRSSNRSELLEIKRRSVKEALNRAASTIESRISGDGYSDALALLIREGLDFVGGTGAVTVADEDLDLCKRLVSSQKLDCTLSGGAPRRGDVVVESHDGRRRVENGLTVRLQRAAEVSVAAVAQRLFE